MPETLPPGYEHAVEPAASRLEVLVVGYSSIDFVWHATSPPAPGRTSLLIGNVDPAPRFGGCGPNVAVELARLGHEVGLASWIGDDEYGRRYLAYLMAAGIDTRGVKVAAGQASPRTLLVYDPDGSATCLYHPSGSHSQQLSAGTARLARAVHAIALTVGPAPLTRAIVAARGPEQVLAWAVKADADAYPPDLRRDLMAAAHVVCLNRDEVAFLAQALAPRSEDPFATIRRACRGLLVVTAGSDDCQVAQGDGWASVPVDHVQLADSTGGGDAFFAALLDAHLAGADPLGAATAATRHAADFLRSRALTDNSEGVPP